MRRDTDIRARGGGTPRSATADSEQSDRKSARMLRSGPSRSESWFRRGTPRRPGRLCWRADPLRRSPSMRRSGPRALWHRILWADHISYRCLGKTPCGCGSSSEGSRNARPVATREPAPARTAQPGWLGPARDAELRARDVAALGAEPSASWPRSGRPKEAGKGAGKDGRKQGWIQDVETKGLYSRLGPGTSPAPN